MREPSPLALRRACARSVSALVKLGAEPRVPGGVIGQVWRDGRRQARRARLLESRVVEVEPLDDRRPRAAGQLPGSTGTSDVIDASLVLCARARGHGVVTSDPADIRRLAPTLRIVPV
ncbi:MAG: hypothetical protein JW940_16145 [Polyangiaceae bacterium]|nr:hypothetical protein [Polyangiaceae bacterium]